MSKEPVPNTQKMKFTKTETEYNMKSIRFLLLTITTMFIIISGLMIVLGISVYSHYHSFSFFYGSQKGVGFFTPSVLSVILGMVLLIVTLFGFFGSFKGSTCMVNMYAFFLSLVLLMEMVVVILAFTMDGKTIMKYIYIPVASYPYDTEIQNEIDSLQVNLNCCGGDSYRDYVAMEFNSNHSTSVLVTESQGDHLSMLVPTSCCARTTDDYCTRLRTNNCKESLVYLVVQNGSVLGVLGVSVMFVQLLGIIFALLLARCFRKMKSEKGLMNWKIKEQMIMSREKEQSEKKEIQSVYISGQDYSVA